MSKDLLSSRAHRDLAIAALRTARRTTGGSALPAAVAPREGSKTCSQRQNEASPLPASQLIALSRPGGHGGVAAPVPIPNTAVKRPSANGTSSQDAGE